MGVGNLGRAFVEYNLRKNNKRKICMAFDVNESKIGSEVGGVGVFDVNDLEVEIKDEAVGIVRVGGVAAE